MKFWAQLDQLIATSQIVIDRPQGSQHPRYPEIVYPLDYGYLEGTTGGDGDGIDVWRGSGNPKQLTGVICTADMHKRDSEIKVLLGCGRQEMTRLMDFLNAHEMGCMLIERAFEDNEA